MIFTCFNKVSPIAFLSELNTLIFILMCFLNTNALLSYCRNTGNPYLNEKMKKYVRIFKFVIVVWNFAFVMKFFFSTLGVTTTDIVSGKEKNAKQDFRFSLETMSNILFTEVLPLYFVIDNKFIKIFTL